jgi:hypothetical protein
MKGLRMLLRPFDEVITYLSGDQHSTYVSNLPMLRKVKAFLNNSLLFDFCTSSKFKDSFKQDYGQESFFNSVVTQFNECRLFLAEQFNSCFTGLDSSLMWSSLFDPRFVSCEHMIGLEKQNDLHLVSEEIELIYFAQEPSRVAHGINEVSNSESEECSSNSDDDQFILGLELKKASKRRAADDALHCPQSI